MIIPYLAFNGDCEAALKRYVDVFGGQVLWMSRYTEETGGAEMAGKVMHAEFEISGTHMSGADQPKRVEHSGECKLMVHLDSREQAEVCCEKLAEGGELLQRLTPHPPPDDAGMGALVRDPFGYTWIVTAPNDHRNG